RLEILHELAPTARACAVLLNPANPNIAIQSKELESAARKLGLDLDILRASSAADIDAAFVSLAARRSNGLVIGADAFFDNRREQLAALSIRPHVPTIFPFREFTAAGGLLSYGGSAVDAYRLVGTYAGRILRGEIAGDLPVQQSTRVELIVNLKTAKALD